MAMKEWLYRFQPLQLYIMFTLTLLYVLVQFFMSHVSHSLTLLVSTYHMLCNIIALTGCIITIKHSNEPHPEKVEFLSSVHDEKTKSAIESSDETHDHSDGHAHSHSTASHQQQLRNTFGWTRIDVLTMLIVCIFLASLCFSALIAALQNLVHMDQQDTMHHHVSVLALAIIGLLLNGLCYMLIGGYTYHQGSFLHLSSSGVVVLERVTVTQPDDGEHRLKGTVGTSNSDSSCDNKVPVETEMRVRRLHWHDICRDLCSSVIVIVCCVLVELMADNENISKYIDPVVSVVACVVLLTLSYPYMKESGLILLQTMPGSIDIEVFKTDLLSQFSDIVSVHDIHIWQLTANKLVSTAHIIFQNTHVYARTKDDIESYFQQKGITIVTIQPEFAVVPKKSDSQCLVECQSTDCIDKICCSPSINAPADSTIDLKQAAANGVARKAYSSSDDVRRRSSISMDPGAVKAKSLLSLDASMLFAMGAVTKRRPSNAMLDVVKTDQLHVDNTESMQQTKANELIAKHDYAVTPSLAAEQSVTMETSDSNQTKRQD